MNWKIILAISLLVGLVVSGFEYLIKNSGNEHKTKGKELKVDSKKEKAVFNGWNWTALIACGLLAPLFFAFLFTAEEFDFIIFLWFVIFLVGFILMIRQLIRSRKVK